MGLLQQSQWLKQCLQNNVKWFNSTNESPGKRGNNELRRCNEKRRFIYQNRKRCCGFEYHRRRKTGFVRHNRISETVILRGETLEQKICNVSRANWDGNTDLKAAFERVLEIAKKHNTPQEEMPKAIVVISDMEIDYCGNREWSFYDKMANKFRKAGYVIPNIIFWNVNSRHDVFHADHNRKGVQLASGQSVTVFKQILQNLGYNPVEAMENTINSERYDCITVE